MIAADTLVAIRCTVYNHEPYLRDCLEGFVMQKTNFNYVAIVHDDASTDGSADIIREYASRYPEIIRPIFETENQWSKHDDTLDRIIDDAIISTGAQYVALCEGDDFWTDEYKLQKQVDILERDSELIACVTNCSVVDAKGKTIAESKGNIVLGNIEGRYSLRQFFENSHQYPNLSVLYRLSHSREVRNKTAIMGNPYLGDWTLWVALHCFGDFYYLNQVTCAYRINPTSVTHFNTRKRRIALARENFHLLPAVASILPSGYDDIKTDLTTNNSWMWWDLGHAYFKSHRYIPAIYCAFRCFVQKPHYCCRKIYMTLHDCNRI